MSYLHKKKISQYATVFLLLSVLLIPIDNAYSVGLTLGTVMNLSNNSGVSLQPQIATSGGVIHVVWRDTSSGNKILYSKSTDGGSTFNGGSPGAPVVLSSTSGQNQNPQIAVSGSSVYVIWNNATSGNSDIFFAKSTDGGSTFGSTVNLSNNSALSTNQKIAVSGSNVYVVWQDTSPGSSQIFLSTSTDGGDTFNGGTSLSPGAPVNISNDLGVTPQVALSSSYANIVWTNSTSGNGDIFFSRVTLGTTSASLPVDLSSLTGSSITPQLAASGTNVYVVWNDNHPGNSDIFFANSSDSGGTFATPVNLSSTSSLSLDPQVAISGSNVYVAWSDNTFGSGDILYSKSTDGGTTFNSGTLGSPGTPVNLSNNSGASSKPQIGITGTNVDITWSDTTSGNSGILLVASDDSGATFGSDSNLSNDNTSVAPQISTIGTNSFLVWEDITGNDDVFFRSATTTSADISFDATQYKLSQNATITITDSSSNTNSGLIDTFSTNVKSSSDTTGLAILFTETGQNTGIFTAQVSFTTEASSGTSLKAAPGDTITTTFGIITGTASIYPRTVDFSGITTFDGGAIANIQVTDQNSNLDTGNAETIQVTAKTNTNPTGVTLSLTETGPNTGIFGGASSKLLFAYNNNGLYPTDRTITVSEKDTSLNVDPSTVETTTVTVSSTSDSGFSMNVTETGVNTGIFSGKLRLSSTTADHASDTLLAHVGDILTITHGGKTSHGLVSPNPNASNGIIQINDSGSDSLTATYQDTSSVVATVFDAFAPGGGGGGLVRPGLVLDAVLALSGGNSPPGPSFNLNEFVSSSSLSDTARKSILNHDPFEPIKPTNDSTVPYYPLQIDGKKYLLAGYANTLETVTEHTGIPVVLQLETISKPIVHIGLYTNMRHISDDLTDSDTYIIYDKNQPLQIVDPHGFFDTVTLNTTDDGNKHKFVYHITFAKPMEKSNILIRSWDDKRSSDDTKIFSAWKVIPQESTQTFKSEEFTPALIQTSPSSLQPLTSPELLESIKEWGGYSSQSISDSQLLTEVGISGEHIPKWYLKTTKWVIDGEISQDEFVNAIKYLNEKGIIQ